MILEKKVRLYPTLEKETPIVELTTESIGIDFGIKELAICSNGMTFKNINKTKSVKKLKRTLKRKQRQCSNKYEKNKKGKEYVKTKNIVKLEKQVRLLHRRLSNIRVNHLHQATSMIVKAKPSRVVMETLNIKGIMKNKHLSRAIAEQCLYEFKRQMQYKCELNGIHHQKLVVSVEMQKLNFHYQKEVMFAKIVGVL